MRHKSISLQRALLLPGAFALSLAAMAQSVTITGRVVDETGEGLIGANVKVKGTGIGNVTDVDGRYTITGVNPKATLVVSYVGYESQEVHVEAGQTEYNFNLDFSNNTLEEVVVVGYGSMAKKEISSSVVQIGRDDFNAGAASDAMSLVQGKVAGLNIVSTADANPNSMTDMQVRGATSINAGNGPLVVIDGIAGGDLRNISTQDVESITVLKDAGSAAIYGTRGANGVILVTTKKGAKGEGQTNVTYDSYIALNVAKPHARILTADEFRRSRRGTDYGYDTDWYDLITRPVGYTTNQYVSIDQGHKNGYFTTSLNYKRGNGLDIASGREEYGARFVIEETFLNGFLKFNSSLSARKVHEDWGNDGLFDTALTTNPTLPVYNPDGTYYQASSPTGIHNPVNDLENNVSNGDRNYILGNADLKANLIQLDHHILTTSISYAVQYNDQKSNWFTPSTSSDSYWNSRAGSANINNQRWQTNRLEWLGNYTLALDEHDLKAVVGYSWERSSWRQAYMSNSDFAYDNLSYHGIGTGTWLQDGKATMYAGSSESTLIGFFGRLNYNWKDMLYASASMRYEGCTKFGPNSKWGLFPSLSLAWEATRTPGLESLKDIFQSLKPRVSYGVTGRSDFNAYQAITTYSQRGSYFFNNQWINGYAPSNNANPNLAWEKSTAFNVGVDFVALQSRLRGSVEYFDRRSMDLLYNYTAPQPPFVYNSILVNVGTIKNTGVELTLDYDVLRDGDFKWTTGVVYSHSVSKLTKLSNDVYKASYLELYQKPGVGSSEYFFRVAEGSKIGQFYGYKYAGVDDQGNMMVYKKDGTSVVTTQANAEDKEYIGNGAPTHFLTWNNSLSYKNWDLSMMWRGAFGFDIFNMRKYGMGLQGCGTDNVLLSAYGKDKEVVTGGGVISDFFLEKGNFFKLENVTVGYNFRPNNRKYVENLRVYLAAKNLVTLTGYSGNDPSIVTATGITPGVDSNSAYPMATQVSLGVTIKLH